MKKFILFLTAISVSSYAQEVIRKDIYGIADKHYILLQRGNLMGLENEFGQRIIAFERGYSYISFGNIYEMQRHMFNVIKDKKWGICDENGVEVLPPIYKNVHQMRTGGGHPYIVAKMKKKEYYIFDIEGNRLSDALKDMPYYEDEPGKGFYLWGSHYKKNYIGLVIETPEEYHMLARTRGYTIDDRGVKTVWYYIDRGRQMHGLLNENGDTLIHPSRKYTEIKYDEGFLFKVNKGQKKGYCNMDGTEIVPPEYDFLWTKSTLGGHIYIYASQKGKNGKTVFYDLNGNILIGPDGNHSEESISAMLDTPEEMAEGYRKRQEMEQARAENTMATTTSTPDFQLSVSASTIVGSDNETGSESQLRYGANPVKLKQSKHAEYKMLDHAYDGYVDYLINMQVYPEKFSKSDFDNVPSIQRKMQQIREKIKKFGWNKPKAPQETWIPGKN